MLDLVGRVVLRLEPEGECLESHIDVLAHEHRLLTVTLVHQRQRGGEYAVILDVFPKGCLHLGVVLSLGQDVDPSAVGIDRYAVGDEVVELAPLLLRVLLRLLLDRLVDDAGKGTSIVVDLLVAFLEFIHLLEDGDGDVDVIFLEILHALVVVKDHVGIEYKILLSHGCSV